MILEKVSGLSLAISERTLRSSLTFFSFKAWISVLYFMSFFRAAAFRRMFQSARKVRFFSFLPRKACVHACKRASFAARSLDFLPHLNPFVYFRIFSRFLWACVPLLTLGIKLGIRL